MVKDKKVEQLQHLLALMISRKTMTKIIKKYVKEKNTIVRSHSNE